VVQATCSAERFVFTQVFDADGWEGFGHVLDEITESGFVIVADYENFFDFGDFGNGTEAVFDYGVAGDFEEGLLFTGVSADIETGWSSGAVDTFGWSRESGRKRVPRDGPPT
jgi:hypothetical protein